MKGFSLAVIGIGSMSLTAEVASTTRFVVPVRTVECRLFGLLRVHSARLAWEKLISFFAVCVWDIFEIIFIVPRRIVRFCFW